MDPLRQIRDQVRGGRFSEAVSAIQLVPTSGPWRYEALLLSSRALERLGRLSEAHHAARTVAEAKTCPKKAKIAAEYLLGRIALARGNVDRGLHHLQTCESLADAEGELETLLWSRIDLMRTVSQRAGRDAATPVVSLARVTATRLADAQLTAAFHVFLGEIDGKAGLLGSAERHSNIAINLLTGAPNLWLEATALLNHLIVAYLTCRSAQAIDIGHTALRLAKQSGVSSVLRAIYANLGNVYLAMGDLERAESLFVDARSAFATDDENAAGLLDSMARIRLAQNRFEECRELLDAVDSSIRTASDARLYAYRHSAVTRGKLLLQEGRFQDALNQGDLIVETAKQCDDRLLLVLGLLVQADAQVSLGSRYESFLTLRRLGDLLPVAPPDAYIDYQRIVAHACTIAGLSGDSLWHERLVQKTKAELGFVTPSLSVKSSGISERSSIPDDAFAEGARTALELAAGLFLDWKGEPGIVSDLVDVLGMSGCLSDRSQSSAPNCSDLSNVATRKAELLSLLAARECGAIASTPSTAACVNALTAITAAVQDVQQARRDRREREAAWPDDPPIGNTGNWLVRGQVLEVLNQVRRVARTKVGVVIIGDSGTGKEIVARAIHDYSDRAAKPFIAVNCAALPGHLLESTLFGYRRGAFTGADRDNPGLIRAAAGGTLFLDEIGELGLELQPKLLRFLESGEIAPLGELATIHVDVRIVCATNRNLAALVQQGLFREDLFYRIHVVRLSLKPLRERRDEIPALVTHFVANAAKEFGKGYLPVAEETMERLLLYRWPGNIRQLQNEIRRMVALIETGATLQPDMISDEILDALPIVRPSARHRDEIAVSLEENLPSALARVETEMIKAALREHHGRVDAAAKALGISRKGLYLKRQRLGV